MKNLKKFRIYLSHPIRGKKGADATDEDMVYNCTVASAAADEIRSYLLDWKRMDGFIDVEVYVPGEHDEFVQLAYKAGYLDETQILDIDCMILDTCDLIMLAGDYLSFGMRRELEHAQAHNIPAVGFEEVNPKVMMDLRREIVNTARRK
jgi:hypothetical protein